MAQQTWEVYTGSTAAGSTTIPNTRDALEALQSGNSGATEPSYKVLGTVWEDTTTGLRKIYNGSAWIVAGQLGVIGEVRVFAMAAPSLWLDCDGSAISRTTYAKLFAAIGTTYGVGDGSTTFNLPDAQGRTIIGAGAGSGLTARALGDSAGEETHVLTEAELAAHTHSQNASTASDNASPFYPTLASRGSTLNLANSGNTASTGSDTAHNNMQPFLCLNYAIYAGV
jgi:microcystin-dependent protein